MQLCWKAENERPTMADVLSRLEAVRDDIVHNTPSTTSRRKKMTSSESPKTTPTIQHPHRVDQTPPIASATRKAAPGKTSSSSLSGRPRRPAPKIPEEGSLKRGTTMHPAVPNDAHCPIKRSINANLEAQKSEVISNRHITHKTAEAGILKTNRLFEEMEREKENEAVITGAPHGGLQVEEDPKEGVLFVNRLAEEEGEKVEVERQEMEGGGGWKTEAEGGGFGEENVMEAEEEDDDDFILEPPEEFSQSSMERDDEAAPYPTYHPSQSSYTSIDDFEPNVETSSQQPSSNDHHRVNGVTPPQTSHAHITAHSNMMDIDTREQRKAVNSSKKLGKASSGDKFSHSKMAPVQKSVVEQEERKMRSDEIDEPDFDDNSQYRRPTSRISGLLKRAPSWGRSSTSGDDDMPNVVYDDEVSALLW